MEVHPRMHRFSIIVIFLLFLLLRLITFFNTTVLEDHDSTSLLRTIMAFLTLDSHQIINMDPDRSLFYGFVGAIMSIPGWSIETAGRMVSLFSVIILFVITYILGKHIYDKYSSIISLALLAITPALITLSVAVLTEPLYVTIVYCGIVLFVLHHKKLTLTHVFIMGLCFGLAFLTRLEGLLFIAFIPLMQMVYLLYTNQFKIQFKKYMQWSALYATGFLIIGAIQVGWASYNMGTFALDGRQVWTIILHQPGKMSYEERLFGTVHSPDQSNLSYLKQNPDALHTGGGFSIKGLAKEYARTVIINVYDLFNNQLITLVGPVLLIFFIIGMMTLYKAGKIYEIIFTILFILFGLIAPLLHNVVVRHILVIAPIILIIAGIGIHSTIRFFIYEMTGKKYLRYGIMVLILSIVPLIWIIPLNLTLKAVPQNKEYDPDIIEKVIHIIHQDADPGDDVVVASRKHYLSLFLGSRPQGLLFTDYDSIVDYLRSNMVDYVYLDYQHVISYPFIEDFINGNYNEDFALLYKDYDIYGNKIELYRIIYDKR